MFSIVHFKRLLGPLQQGLRRNRRLAGHLWKALEVWISRRRLDFAGQVDVDTRLDQRCLIERAGAYAQRIRAIGIPTEHLRAAVRAKVFFHIRAAVGRVLEDFRLSADLDRIRVDKQQGAVGRAGGRAAIAAMAIGHQFDIGVPTEFDVPTKALSG